MHSRRKGKSSSKKPLRKTKPVWVTHDTKTTEQLVIKLAKAGNTSSQIGLILRDSYGIPDVKLITNKKINKILKENNLTKKLPEDLTNLIQREIKISKHLKLNKQDKVSNRGLQSTESKIKRLAKYYKKKGILPKTWNYNREEAKLLIE